jgi:hypothetical protein
MTHTQDRPLWLSVAREAWFSFRVIVWALSHIPGDNAKRRVESAGYPPHRKTANYTRRYLRMAAVVVALGFVLFAAVSVPLAFIAIALVFCATVAAVVWFKTPADLATYNPHWPLHEVTMTTTAVDEALMTHATNLPLHILEQALLEIRKSGFRQGERDVITDEGPCNLYEAFLRVIAPTPQARHAIYYGGGYDVSAPSEPEARKAYDALVNVIGEAPWIWQDRDGRTAQDVEDALMTAIGRLRYSK